MADNSRDETVLQLDESELADVHSHRTPSETDDGAREAGDDAAGGSDRRQKRRTWDRQRVTHGRHADSTPAAEIARSTGQPFIRAALQSPQY